MRTWFTADLHFGHKAIIDHCHRPFASVEEMDAAIIERWNEVVEPDDIVWVLGDVAMGNVRHTLPNVVELNGRKLLVPGNHDACWSGHKKWHSWQAKYEAVGFHIQPNEERHEDLVSAPVVLCHFPYSGDHTTEERFTEWRPVDDGKTILLHGHVHNGWKVNGRQINVGVDVWDFRPVSLEQIEAIL